VERESQIIDFSVDVVGVDLGFKSKATLIHWWSIWKSL